MLEDFLHRVGNLLANTITGYKCNLSGSYVGRHNDDGNEEKHTVYTPPYFVGDWETLSVLGEQKMTRLIYSLRYFWETSRECRGSSLT